MSRYLLLSGLVAITLIACTAPEPRPTALPTSATPRLTNAATPTTRRALPGDFPLRFHSSTYTDELTIYDLETRRELTLRLESNLEFAGISPGEDILLASTTADEYAQPWERQYHMVDLRTGEIIEAEINIGQNFFLVRENV